MPTNKSKNNSISLAFKEVKEDITSLKRAKNQFSTQLSSLAADAQSLSKQKAQDSAVRSLSHEIDTLKQEKKRIAKLTEDFSDLKSEAIIRKEYAKEQKRVDKDLKKLHGELLAIKKIKDSVNASRIADLEKHQVQLDDVKKAVLEDIQKTYFTADEFTKELSTLRKEYAELQVKIAKVKKDVVNFPRSRILANLLLLLAFISLAGGAIAIWLSYIQAANFLVIEGGILLFMGVFVHLIIALLK